MATVYGILANPFIEFDGTNIQEIHDAFYPESTIDGTDRLYVTGTGSGDYDFTFQQGEMVGYYQQISPADWAEKYVKVS